MCRSIRGSGRALLGKEGRVEEETVREGKKQRRNAAWKGTLQEEKSEENWNMGKMMCMEEKGDVRLCIVMWVRERKREHCRVVWVGREGSRDSVGGEGKEGRIG